MIQIEDVIDRKLISLAGRYRAALTRLIDENIDPSFFSEQYRAIVKRMFDYYKKHFELITPDALTDILCDEKEKTENVTIFVATFEEILEDASLNGRQTEMSELDHFIARIKHRKALKAIERAAGMLGRAVDSFQIEEAREILIKTLTEIDKVNGSQKIQEGSLADLADLRLKLYEEKKKNPHKFKGVFSGFPALDKETDGFQPGQLIIYVAAPSGGKSVCLLHTAFHAWQEKFPGAGIGANVVLFTLEMDWEQYLRRFDARHAAINTIKLKSATLEEHEYRAWEECINEQKNKENFLYIVDMPAGCNTLFIRNKLDEIRLKYPNRTIDLVVIDYLGIMDTPQKVDGDWLRQGYISQECKELARNEKVPVVTAVQETRESIKSKDKSKNTAVLSRSQMIPANADIIIFLEKEVKESNEEFDVFKDYNNNPNTMLFQTVKHRDGKQVKWKCGAEFGVMLLQPNEDDDESDITAPIRDNPEIKSKPAITKKAEPAQKALKEQRDDDQFESYYAKANKK